MILYFQAKLSELRLTYSEFFAVAYQAVYNPPRLPMLHDDEAQWLMHSVLPTYVVTFLKYLQENERARNCVLEMPESGERPFDSAFHLNIGDEEDMRPR